jgi:hypothetical protein
MFILSDLPGVLRSAILDRQQAWGPQGTIKFNPEIILLCMDSEVLC